MLQHVGQYQNSQTFYACVEANFEELERVYEERYQKQHGYWRPIIRRVIYEFLDCGDLRHGFARAAISSSTQVFGTSGFQLVFSFCASPLQMKTAQANKSKRVKKQSFDFLESISTLFRCIEP